MHAPKKMAVARKKVHRFGTLPPGAQRYIRENQIQAPLVAPRRPKWRLNVDLTAASDVHAEAKPAHKRSRSRSRERDVEDKTASSIIRACEIQHPRDARIRLDKRLEKYVVDDKVVEGRVTSFISAFFPGFNANLSAQRMVGRSDFPFRESDAVYRSLPIFEVDGRLRAEAVQIITKKWTTDGTVAKEAGTRMHALIEKRCKTDNPCVPLLHTEELRAAEQEFSVEMAQFETYYRDRLAQGWVPYRSEQFVYDEEHQMCGAIDMQWRRREHGGKDAYGRTHILIADWKRTDKLRKEAYGGDTGYGPMSVYPANKASLYELQTGVYRWIKERNYGEIVDAIEVVAFHPDLLSGQYDCLQSDMSRDTVNAVMAERAAMLRRNESQKDLTRRLRGM